MIAERDERAVAVEPGLEMMESRGPVEIVADIVGTVPQELDRHAGVLRDRGGLDGIVAGSAPAEAAAAASQVNRDVLRVQPKRAGNHRAIARIVFRREPILAKRRFELIALLELGGALEMDP